MAFVIRLLKNEDIDRIYPEKERNAINSHIQMRNWGPNRNTWARDEERDAYLIWAGGGREMDPYTYLFSWGDEIVIFKMKSYCLFSFIYVSESLLPRIEEAKTLIAEALSVSGLLLEGNDKTIDYMRVPHAEFLPYPNAGA